MGKGRYKIFENEYPYFLTCTVVNWLPVFRLKEAKQIILESLNFLQTNERVELNAYVIMEDHLHLIATSLNLPKEIANFKSFTARKIIDLLKCRDDKKTLNILREGKPVSKKDSNFKF